MRAILANFRKEYEMTVRIILKSKEGLCVEYFNIDNIDEIDDMIILQGRLNGKEKIYPIIKKKIKHIKVIPGKEEIK